MFVNSELFLYYNKINANIFLSVNVFMKLALFQTVLKDMSFAALWGNVRKSDRVRYFGACLLYTNWLSVLFYEDIQHTICKLYVK